MFQRIIRKFGQRTHKRFTIPGATVAWTYVGQEFIPDETLPLSDISRSGLSFLTNHPPNVASELSIRLNLPKQPGAIEVHGRVVYSLLRGPNLTYEYRVGVELRPFSKIPGDNSLQSQKAIEELEHTYGKKSDMQLIER